MDLARMMVIHLLVILGAAAALGLAVVLVTVNWDSKSVISLPPTSTPSAEADQLNPTVSVTDEGIRVGSTHAPVRVDIYEDFACPHCAEYHSRLEPAIADLLSEEKISVMYHLMDTMTKYGIRAGNAATCVALHRPSSWGEAHDALFNAYGARSAEWSRTEFSDFMKRIAVSDDRIDTCVTTGRYEGWIRDNVGAAAADGVTRTPTLIIDDVERSLMGPDELRHLVEGLIAETTAP